MNDIINTSNQTPIEIALGIDEEGMTTARKLYAFLEMDSKNYSRWCKRNITENEFAEENIDYFYSSSMKSEQGRGNFAEDCKLSASFAKKLSMQSKTSKGEQARQYFLKVEDKLKETVRRTVPMSPLEQLQLQAQAILQVNEKVDALDEKLERFKLDLPILPIEADRITEAVHKRGVDILGGKGSHAYQDKSIRQRVYSGIYADLKTNFRVRSYKSIKRNQCDAALNIIARYNAPLYLAVFAVSIYIIFISSPENDISLISCIPEPMRNLQTVFFFQNHNDGCTNRQIDLSWRSSF
jgi:phage anti-repressor protein